MKHRMIETRNQKAETRLKRFEMEYWVKFYNDLKEILNDTFLFVIKVSKF